MFFDKNSKVLEIQAKFVRKIKEYNIIIPIAYSLKLTNIVIF